MIKVKKGSVEKSIHDHKLSKYIEAGWEQDLPVKQVKAVDEVVRLKPPVKTKATVRALDEANHLDDKGDE
jgi:hypothetical protein